MSLVADELRDVEMNSDDRQVYVGEDGDLATTEGVHTVEQSLAITAGDVLRPLIGEPLSQQTLGDIEATLKESLQNDPQISNVRAVNVTQVNRGSGTVSVTVVTAFNNQFELQVNP